MTILHIAPRAESKAQPSNLTEPRSPEKEFHCPLWPGCGCPGGTMHPACPGLKAELGALDQPQTNPQSKGEDMLDTQTETTGLTDHLIGKYVIIRATAAGVHAGTLAAHDGGQTVRLTNSRRLWRWTAKKGHTLSGVATYGVKEGWTKIPAAVDDLVITDACEIISTTKDAQTSIEEWPVYEP